MKTRVPRSNPLQALSKLSQKIYITVMGTKTSLKVSSEKKKRTAKGKEVMEA
jgi:hypothetical protein